MEQPRALDRIQSAAAHFVCRGAERERAGLAAQCDLDLSVADNQQLLAGEMRLCEQLPEHGFL